MVRAEIAEPIPRRTWRDYPEQYLDPNGLWTPTRLSYYCIAYNTNLVPAADVPKTFEDLLDPNGRARCPGASAAQAARRCS